MTTVHNKTDEILQTTNNIMLMPDTHNIPKGKTFLLNHIVCKITQSNNMSRANTCDTILKHMHEEITSNIQKDNQNQWTEHLGAPWDHRHNTHIIGKSMHGLSQGYKDITLHLQLKTQNT